MKITSKSHWSGFIYGLLYPGFIGSMIYELIPQSQLELSFNNYFNLDTIIKILITLFYSVDYLHLYGDMNETVKEDKRHWIYLLCDVFTSVLFFLCFVAVKLGYYDFSILYMSIIPVIIFLYKKKNKFDNKFYQPYVILNTVVILLVLFNKFNLFHSALLNNEKLFLCYLVLISLLIYCYYVFIFYEKKSKKEDQKIYQ